MAKDKFKKEYPGFPPLEVPLAYPITECIYDDIPMGDELERTWSVNQFKRAFKEILVTHDHLVPMALDHDLDSPCPIAYSPPSLDDQLLDEFYDDMDNREEFTFPTFLYHDYPVPCVDAPPTSEVLVEVPCVLHTNAPLTHVHDHPASEPKDLEVDMPVIEESQVHTVSVPSVESHPTPLSHCEMLPIVLLHAQLDACYTLPIASLLLPFIRSSFGFSSRYEKSIFVVFLAFLFLLSLFHSPTSAVVGSEFDKLLRSLTHYIESPV